MHDFILDLGTQCGNVANTGIQALLMLKQWCRRRNLVNQTFLRNKVYQRCRHNNGKVHLWFIGKPVVPTHPLPSVSFSMCSRKEPFEIYSTGLQHTRSSKCTYCHLNKWQSTEESSSTVHTHPFNGHFPGLPRWAGTRKVKSNLDFTEARDSEWQWHQLGKSSPHFRQITMPAPNHSVFLQARWPSCRPTNRVKALKAQVQCASGTAKCTKR